MEARLLQGFRLLVLYLPWLLKARLWFLHITLRRSLKAALGVVRLRLLRLLQLLSALFFLLLRRLRLSEDNLRFGGARCS